MDEGKIEKGGKLVTISEILSDDESSLDSNEEVERKLKELRERFEVMKSVDGRRADELNAEAVRILDERATQDAKRKVTLKKSEIFNLSAFG